MHSQPVHTNQTGPHADLEKTVRKHLQHDWRRPLPTWVESLADQCLQQHADAPWILDSGCGTGHSSVWLAKRYPDHWVIGADQSAHRLSKADRSGKATTVGETTETAKPDNLVLLRVDLQDWWRALHRRQVTLARHTVLYPNPWPKAQHLMRRWHGHPVWPHLLALGGELELRTNWPVYAQEFALALQWSTGRNPTRQTLDNASLLKDPLTLFEKKYAASGHAISQVTMMLKGPDPSAP